ncbi:hypothetical protein EV368DRAFT_68002 [Lentinula lateritia]|nr:hypothetical protein EV368DRAFT_68002 [Lentinula lateritia]
MTRIKGMKHSLLGMSVLGRGCRSVWLNDEGVTARRCMIESAEGVVRADLHSIDDAVIDVLFRFIWHLVHMVEFVWRFRVSDKAFMEECEVVRFMVVIQIVMTGFAVRVLNIGTDLFNNIVRDIQVNVGRRSDCVEIMIELAASLYVKMNSSRNVNGNANWNSADWRGRCEKKHRNTDCRDRSKAGQAGIHGRCRIVRYGWRKNRGGRSTNVKISDKETQPLPTNEVVGENLLSEDPEVRAMSRTTRFDILSNAWEERERIIKHFNEPDSKLRLSIAHHKWEGSGKVTY